MTSWVVFSDLDGCFLNEDYTYQESLPALESLRKHKIPLVLVSSKTEAEIGWLVLELGLKSPFVCENGGVICWNRGSDSIHESRTILGRSRVQILEFLSTLKPEFSFRSFADLGVDGISELTGLDAVQAGRAAERQTNEPLVWDDDPVRLEAFHQRIDQEGLTLTRGGRFWHIAGKVNKGTGLRHVVDHWEAIPKVARTMGIGDSPIDQPLLENADVAVVIPRPSGEILIQIQHSQLVVASVPGARGWAEAIFKVLDGSTRDEVNHG
ncbi:MAG: HAD-IIB family hydrolase [Planctomycetota bacterium]|nr:HAD-IIB family hydrolase [Planctomycetota bacterium]